MQNHSFVMMDSKELHHLILQVESLVDEVRQLNSKRELQEKYMDTENENVPLLTPKQLAAKLNKSIATIYSWRAQGIIKAHKIGRSTYFDLNEVLQVVKS
jgi:uncharacterized protein YajQ (UPF0234 family)